MVDIAPPIIRPAPILVSTSVSVPKSLDHSAVLSTIIVPVRQRKGASGCPVSHRNQANLQRRPHRLCATFATTGHRLFVAFVWSNPTLFNTAWAACPTVQRQLNGDDAQHSGGTDQRAEPGPYGAVTGNSAWPTVAEARAPVAAKRHATRRATARPMPGLTGPAAACAVGRTHRSTAARPRPVRIPGPEFDSRCATSGFWAEYRPHRYEHCGGTIKNRSDGDCPRGVKSYSCRWLSLFCALK